MRMNPKFRSDGFQIVDDRDHSFFFEDALEDYCIDDAHRDSEDRRQALWQQLKCHISEHALNHGSDEWDYWDEYLAIH